MKGHRVISVLTSQVNTKENPMALDKDALSGLLDALRAGGDIDVVRVGMQLVAHRPLRATRRAPDAPKRRR